MCHCKLIILIIIYVITEPNGRVKGVVQDDHNVPVVPAFVGHPVSEQEGLAWGEDHVFSSRRLLPRIWRYVCDLNRITNEINALVSWLNRILPIG